MGFLPEPALGQALTGEVVPTRRTQRSLVKAERKAVERVGHHEVVAWERTQRDAIDSMAAGIAAAAALEEEVGLYEHYRTRAAGDPVKEALVMRKADQLSQINDRRLRRRFG